jgi:protein-S-isoprenylcysteine O-methyltransferase Ste14
MTAAALVILGHQLLFQGLFLAKNLYLGNKLGRRIRGDSREANQAIRFFAAYIVLAFILSATPSPPGSYHLMATGTALAIGGLVLALNLLLGLASLLHLGDAWRVGIVADTDTALVERGIYRYSRNPYFVAYLLMFIAYPLLLQNALLLGLAPVGAWLVHRMVLAEEAHLRRLHGAAYQRYCARVPRYLLF